MIADLKPYAEYKESGSPWLGQVPGHWSTRVLKRLCSRSALYGANIPASDYVSAGVRFLRTTDITDDGTLRRGGVFVAHTAAQDYMLADGDLLVSRSGTIGRSLRYRAEVHGPCAYAGYLVRFVPAPIASADYLFHFTKSLAFADFIRVSAVSSTIENVNGEKYANMPVPLPPPDEQAAIARFLDWANGRLERAIRAKRKVIALLNEQKQAIIHRAVTRGLDPSVPLKPSGIPWLGDIPQHWELRRLKHAFKRIVGGSTPASSNLDYWNGDVMWVTPADVSKSAFLTGSIRTISRKGLHACSTEIVPAGSIIFTSRAPVGNVAIARVPLCTNQGCKALIPDTSTILPMFGFWLLSLMKSELQSRASGTTFLEISTTKLSGSAVALPALEEQERILYFIATETDALVTAISRLERETELLREYRTRLVADVVTGKLDVREAAARLPDEVAPDTPEESADVSDETEPFADETAA